MIPYNTMPTEAVEKVAKFNRNDSATEILFDKRPMQVTEVARTKSSTGTQEAQCCHILNQLGEIGCAHMWNPHGATRCVITMNKLISTSISTSEFKDISRTVASQRGPGEASLVKLVKRTCS